VYEKLKEIRIKKGYSIEQIAKVIEKSPCNYFKKENGEVKFSVSEAIKISKFLHKKVEDIFFTDELSVSETKK